MPGRSVRRRAALVLLAATLSGCASTTAPPRWLPDAENAGEFPYGGWVTVDSREAEKKKKTHGELVAVTDSSLFVQETAEGRELGTHPGAVTEIRKKDIKKVKLMSYTADLAPVIGWATVGTISTLSHGIVLLLSAPLWILVGTASTITAADEPQIVFPKESWDSLRRFARFPQGLPEGFR